MIPPRRGWPWRALTLAGLALGSLWPATARSQSSEPRRPGPDGAERRDADPPDRRDGDRPRDEESPAEKGRDLKSTVKESEKALLDEVERLKKAIGVPDGDAPSARPGSAPEGEGPSARKPEVWDQCEPGCPRCARKEFCEKRAQKVYESCQRVISEESHLKARFVQLRVDYRKLTGFLSTEADRLAREAEHPPDGDSLEPADREQLRKSYLDMASHVRELRPTYEVRFNALEKDEAAALGQLAVLRSKASVLGDALEVLKATGDLQELKQEISSLEQNIQEMSAAVDKTLNAFSSLAQTLKVEK